MNYSVLFSIKIGGPSQNLEILKKALESISSNIFTENYQIFLFFRPFILRFFIFFCH